jgi:hypothetical protein
MALVSRAERAFKYRALAYITYFRRGHQFFPLKRAVIQSKARSLRLKDPENA